MGAYKYIRKTMAEHAKKDIVAWSRQPVIYRLSTPTNVVRAHALGYKAKQGFVVARARIKKGSRKRPRPRKGRKPRSLGVFFTPDTNKQAIAERRAARKYPNLEVLNSYKVGSSGTHHFYEVILVDKNHPVVRADKERNWIVSQRRRAFRGLTSAARKARGLR